MYRVTMVLAALLGCGASSCALSDPHAPLNAPDPVVARRAAFDLNCPIEQLAFVAIQQDTPRTYGVVGCNKRVTYVEMCSIARWGGGGILQDQSCQWAMNGPIQVQTPVPPFASATSAAPAPAPAPGASAMAP